MVLAEKRSKRLRSTNAVKKVGILNKSLNFIEKIGNKLPDPVTLFVLLSILTIIASFILGNAGVSAEYETVKDGVSEVVKVDAVNLLTKSSMAEFLKNIVSNKVIDTKTVPTALKPEISKNFLYSYSILTSELKQVINAVAILYIKSRFKLNLSSINNFTKKDEAENCLSYIKTKFFRALLFYNRHSLNISRESFNLIPLQDFSEPWTDEKLYKKYGLTEDEIAFIDSMIRPME